MPRQQKTKRKISLPPAPQPKERPALPPKLLGVADAPNAGQPDSAHPSWRLALLDLEPAPEWSWEVGEAELTKIIAFLTEMERLTWGQVKAQLSVADAALMATAVVTGDAFHLYLRTPWWAVLAVAWGGTILFAFGAGFVRGFGRSVLHDVKQWRARR